MKIILRDERGMMSGYLFTLNVHPAINKRPPKFAPVLPSEVLLLALGENHDEQLGQITDIDPEDLNPSIELSPPTPLIPYLKLDKATLTLTITAPSLSLIHI